MRLRYVRRLKKVKQFLEKHDNLCKFKVPYVGKKFGPWDMSRRQIVSSQKGWGIGLDRIEDFKDVLRFAQSSNYAMNVIGYRYHTYDQGVITARRDCIAVPEQFTLYPSQYPELLNSCKAFYNKSNGRLYYIGRITGKYSERQVVFPKILPANSYALKQCVIDGYIDKAVADKVSNFVVVGSGESSIRLPLNISAKDTSSRVSFKEIRRVILRRFDASEFPERPLKVKDGRHFLSDLHVKRNTACGVRDTQYFGAARKEQVCELAYMHALNQFTRICNGELVISDCIYKQGSRPKAYKIKHEGFQELVGRGVMMTETWENICSSMCLAPLKRFVDSNSRSIYASYSRAHQGHKRQLDDQKNNTHKFSGDFAKGEFHFDLRSKLLSAAFSFANYETTRASMAAALYYYSNFAYVKVVFAGGHVLSAENYLPSGMAHMGLVWGSLNRFIYYSMGDFVLKYASKKLGASYNRSNFNITVLGDDGSINIQLLDSSGNKIHKWLGKIVPNYVMRKRYWRIFRFDVDTFNWSQFGGSVEQQADFLKEVILDGKTYWKASALLSTLVTTQRAYFTTLKCKSKADKGSSLNMDKLFNGLHYDSFSHWKAIADAGVNITHEHIWFIEYGAHLFTYQNSWCSYEVAKKICDLIVKNGIDKVLESPGLSGYRYYFDTYVKDRSVSEYINLKFIHDRIMSRRNGTAMPVLSDFATLSEFRRKQVAKYRDAMGLSKGSVPMLPDLRRVRRLAKYGFDGQSSDRRFRFLYSKGMLTKATVGFSVTDFIPPLG